jgi:CHASE2 domain-containing sensor protein
MELFKLRFSPMDHPSRFKAIVGSSVGEQEEDLLLPFFDGDKDWRTTLIKTFELSTFKSADFNQNGEQDWMVKAGILNKNRQAFHLDLLKNVGQALYRSLFPVNGKLEGLLKSALRDIGRQHPSYLHIQLTFQGDLAKKARFADYPWELLHDGAKFLAHRKVTFSRYIADDSAPPNLPPVEKINVLLISSAAFDTEQKLESLSPPERQAILKGLEKAQTKGHIRLISLENATTECLRAYLTEHQVHVVHFDGHGLFGKRCRECRVIHKGIKAERCRNCNTPMGDVLPQGYLVFEDAQGKPDYVSAEDFSQLLQTASARDRKVSSNGIVLAVLSACQSGMSAMGDSVFNGTAQNLISNAVPSVVAMQYSITVDGAAKFAEQFYRSLGSKDSLALAVRKGREAMGMGGMDQQWFRPVLYLRWRDNEGGQLFASNKSEPICHRLITSIVWGTAVTSGIVAFRLMGAFQWWELKAYDMLMNLRLPDNWDENIIIVGADSEDLKKFGNPIPDKNIQDLLNQLTKTYGVEIIGLDIYRHKPTDTEQDYKSLVDYIQENNEISPICRSQQGEGYKGTDQPVIPLTLNKSQDNDSENQEIRHRIDENKQRVGFSDSPTDGDPTGSPIRRQILRMATTPESSCQTEYSLSYQIANRFLEKEGYKSFWDVNSGKLFFQRKEENQEKSILFSPLGVSDWGLSALTTEGPAGGYQINGYNPGPYQVMLNYLNKMPDVIHFREIIGKNVNSELVRRKLVGEDKRKKIVLIGYIDTEVKGAGDVDLHITPIHPRMPGVFIHAHMTSQIIQVALGKRKLIWYWPPEGEILWIWIWSILGGALVWRNRPIVCLVWIAIGLAIAPLTICWIFFQFSGWVPLVSPILAAFSTYGIIVFIDLRERDLKLANILEPWTR